MKKIRKLKHAIHAAAVAGPSFETRDLTRMLRLAFKALPKKKREVVLEKYRQHFQVAAPTDVSPIE